MSAICVNSGTALRLAGKLSPRLDRGSRRAWLGSNPDPDPDPNNRQRYDDHQHVNRQPSGYAFRRLGHSVCPRGPRYAANERKWL